MQENIEERNIEEELKNSYLTYAMSVNTNRAIPDVRDGLKPSTRRIVYAMGQINLFSNKNYDKCAAVVGEVMKNYHPHSDAGIYSTLVGLAQDFSIRYPLVDGQGNFGSIDDDPPGAMRYTECKLAKLANTMLLDIHKNTVDFQLNYKDSTKEPVVLPALLPNLLVNGTTGIGVGYLTRIPPHNLGEIVDTLLLRLERPNSTLEELMQLLPGPDFPTGALIVGNNGIKNMYTTGKGSITMQAKVKIERLQISKNSSKDRIIVEELPYQVKKNQLLQKIYDLVVQKTITGISDIRDESDKDIRIVLELKKGEIAEVILNQLYKHTQMQLNFNAILLCLVNGLPQTLCLSEILDHYLKHRTEVLTRKTQFELEKAEARYHIVEGYKIALKSLQEIIELIQNVETPQMALEVLETNYNLSNIQAKEILSLTLRQLTGLERVKINDEYENLKQTITKLKKILEDPNLIKKLLKEELKQLKKEYGDTRRTKIVGAVKDVKIEDLITNEKVVVTLSHKGYIKRIAVSEYKKQKRGRIGSKGSSAKENDYVEHLFIADTHNYVLFFTNTGKCYGLKVHEIPEGSKQSIGRAIINFLPRLESHEKIASFIPVIDFKENYSIFMVTKNAIVKKCKASLFQKLTSKGLIAIRLNEGDELVDIQLTKPQDDILLLTRKGYYTRFKEEDISVTGRNSKGVRGIKLNEGDKIIKMIAINDSVLEDLLIVTEKGYGKRSKLENYLTKKRGRSSIKAIIQNDTIGPIVSANLIKDSDELVIMNSKGKITRIEAGTIPRKGRIAQGVKIMKLPEDSTVVDIGKIGDIEL